MKRLNRTLSLMIVVAACCGYQATAQNSTPEKVAPSSIFEALQSAKPGEGTVTIHQSSEIKNLVGHVYSPMGASLTKEGDAYMTNGFRIQAYTGNTARSKAEVYERAEMIRKNFPEHNCYITFKSPFWRLQVGDFLSREDANELKRNIARMNPNIGKELYVISDKVRIRKSSLGGSDDLDTDE